jgi:hypothetical protein
MEKILLALDARNIHTNTVDFACYIANLTQSRLTGVFLENLLADDQPVLQETGPGASFQDRATATVPDQTQPPGSTEENIRSFRESCQCRSVSAFTHRDRGVPLEEMVEESRFADLVIIDPETSFSRKNEAVPGRFVKDILQETECPVITAPYSFESIDTIIFAYNGSPSSVFAIKQFTYLFPQLRQKKIIVVNVRFKEEAAIEQQYKMKEWLRQHYTDIEFKILTGDPSDELFGFLIEKKNSIVVMGAYGRSMLSRFLKPSHARLIVKTVNLPIFIAHH